MRRPVLRWNFGKARKGAIMEIDLPYMAELAGKPAEVKDKHTSL